MIDVVGEKARLRWRRILVNKMMRLEPAMRKDMRTIFNRQAMKATDLIAQGVTRVDRVLDNDIPVLGATLVKHYKRCAILFSDDAFKAVAKEKSGVAPETKGMRDDFWRFFNQWAQVQAAGKAVGLNEVTKRLISRQITRAQKEGMSYGETAKLIRKRVPELSVTRAARIARTEVHTAANLSTDKAIESTRLKFEREWMVVKDERTRELHARPGVDGQRRGMNEPFDVGGQKLMYPGDPKGSAGNIINCRCVLLYHRVKSMQRRTAQ